MNEIWNQAFFAGFHGSDSFVAKIPIDVAREGDSMFVGGGEITLNKISASFSMPLRVAQGMSVEEFIGTAAKMGSELGRERAKGFFQAFPAPSPHAMAFEWKQPLQFQQVLDVWEKMQIDFGPDGLPIWPQVVLNAKGYDEFQKKLPEWQQDPECNRKWADLVERKRKEFDEREARRRLVD